MNEQKNKKSVGEVFGKISAIVAIIYTLCVIVFVLLFAFVGGWGEHLSGLSGLYNIFKDNLILLVEFLTTMSLAVWGGIYGGKIALSDPKKGGWIMFACGIISLLDSQLPAGCLLIIAGIYTIFFQKTSTKIVLGK